MATTTEKSLSIKQIILLLSGGHDEIFLETGHQAPQWADSDPECKPLRPSFHVPKNTGRQYVIDNFGQEPDKVVDVRFLPDY